MSVIFTNCADCKNMEKNGDVFKCIAFPKGIPLKYMFRADQTRMRFVITA